MNPQSSAAPHPRPRIDRRAVLLLLAGLLMPGGILLLAWMLARRILPRLNGAAARRVASMVLLAASLQGCATQLALPVERARDAETGTAVPRLRFQSLSTEPTGEGAFVTTENLRPGDILLTSMPGLVGAGIELMTVAPVSHAAIYVGDGRIVEALRPAVRERAITTVMVEETEALVLRHPGLTAAQARRILDYAERKRGARFNYVGVTLQIPLVIGRRACELPLVPGVARDACIRGMGALNQFVSTERRLFCSQLVLEAYRHAGVPLTEVDASIVSPADILHMREGDVPSFLIATPLRYVGHLKYDRPKVALSL